MNIFKKLNKLDLALSSDQSFLGKKIQSKWLKKMIKMFSINPKLAYVFFISISFLCFGNRYFWNIIIFFICDLFIWCLKRIIKRKRPAVYKSSKLLIMTGLGPDKYSFPSAHSFTAFQLIPISFIMFSWTGIIFVFYALMVGFSRIFQKHHFLTDVLGGASLGIIIGILNILIIK